MRKIDTFKYGVLGTYLVIAMPTFLQSINNNNSHNTGNYSNYYSVSECWEKQLLSKNCPERNDLNQ